MSAKLVSWSFASFLFALCVVPQMIACGSSTPAERDAHIDGDTDSDADGDADGDVDGDVDGDADVEMDADGPPSVRRLGERRLFGDMPLNNGFYDPGFSLLDSIGWSAVGSSWWDTGEVTRVFLAWTPMGQPALHVPMRGNPYGLTVTGAAKGVAGPMEVSVWIARADGAEDPDFEEITSSLTGLFPGERRDMAVDLEPDETTSVRVEEGLRWRRFVAALPEGPVGWASLSVTDDTDEDFYLSSPLLIPIESGSGAGARLIRRADPLPRRQLRQAELNAIAIHRELMRERLGR